MCMRVTLCVRVCVHRLSHTERHNHMHTQSHMHTYDQNNLEHGRQSHLNLDSCTLLYPHNVAVKWE